MGRVAASTVAGLWSVFGIFASSSGRWQQNTINLSHKPLPWFFVTRFHGFFNACIVEIALVAHGRVARYFDDIADRLEAVKTKIVEFMEILCIFLTFLVFSSEWAFPRGHRRDIL